MGLKTAIHWAASQAIYVLDGIDELYTGLPDIAVQCRLQILGRDIDIARLSRGRPAKCDHCGRTK